MRHNILSIQTSRICYRKFQWWLIKILNVHLTKLHHLMHQQLWRRQSNRFLSVRIGTPGFTGGMSCVMKEKFRTSSTIQSRGSMDQSGSRHELQVKKWVMWVERLLWCEISLLSCVRYWIMDMWRGISSCWILKVGFEGCRLMLWFTLCCMNRWTWSDHQC